MTRFRIVNTRSWTDPRLRALSRPKPNAQTLWDWLQGAGWDRSIPGLLDGGPGLASDKLGWPYRSTVRVLRELVGAGMVEWDESAGVMWVPERTTDPAAGYPSQRGAIRAWLAQLVDVTPCELRSKAIRAAGLVFVGRDLARRAQGEDMFWAEAYREALRDLDPDLEVDLELGLELGLEVDLEPDPEVDLEVGLLTKTQNPKTGGGGARPPLRVVKPTAGAPPPKAQLEVDPEPDLEVDPRPAAEAWAQHAVPAGFPQAPRRKRRLKAPPLPWRDDGPTDLPRALDELFERLARCCAWAAAPGRGHKPWGLAQALTHAPEIMAGEFDSPAAAAASRRRRTAASSAPSTPEPPSFDAPPEASPEWREMRAKLLGSGEGRGEKM